ncbi:MAG: DUF2807 domain-containing protein [Bacteroidales bacterium]|nr:DUF2807 domain-containing protein [Bacteroidales bacterium]
MIRKVITILFTIPLLILHGCVINLGDSVSGSGHVVEETRNIGNFNSLKVSNGFDVFITQVNEPYLRVEVDDNLLEHLKTEVSDNTLKIYSKVNINNARSQKVYVGYKNLNEINISSAGDVRGENTMHTSNLNIRLSSAGDLKLDLIAEEVDIDISSSGNAILSGQTHSLYAGLSSAGDLNAYELEAKTASVNVSSAGNAKVYVTDEARFNSSSAGDIYYKGNPEILESQSSSGGDIRKRN